MGSLISSSPLPGFYFRGQHGCWHARMQPGAAQQGVSQVWDGFVILGCEEFMTHLEECMTYHAAAYSLSQGVHGIVGVSNMWMGSFF